MTVKPKSEVTEENAAGKKHVAYAYDPIYRITDVHCSDGGIVNYRYDRAGNRLSMKRSHGKVKYVYDGQDRLTKTGSTAFKYDANGSIVEKKDGPAITRYRYDFEGRLVQIDYADGTRSKYDYDSLGKRVGKTDRTGRTTHYVYSGDNIIEELDGSGQLLASYVHGPRGVDHPVSMKRGGKVYFYIYDHLGSVVGLTDQDGALVCRYEYDEWGNVLSENGDIENPFRFTGREWDADSRLHYCHSRYYDPELGRFISKDPLYGFDTSPQGLNAYAYAANNPTTNVDPYGLRAQRPRGGAGHAAPVTSAPPLAPFAITSFPQGAARFLVNSGFQYMKLGTPAAHHLGGGAQCCG